MTTESKAEEQQTATLLQTFSLADRYDVYLMTVGTIGAAVSGIMLPVSNVVFGRIMDKLNSSDQDTFQDAIDYLAVVFVIIGAISTLAGYFQVTYWATTGERQAQRFRERYVQAILSQEIGWFDVNGASTLSTKVADLTGKIQDGMGRKFGDFLFNIIQFIASVAVSFYLSWKLSLVLLASIPFIVASGYFLVVTTTAAQQQALEQYALAGGLASQTLNSVRTVHALNVQPSVISQYRTFLYDALLVGLRKAVHVGLGNGGLHAALFLTNGLCYWYGGELVADDVKRGCISGDRCVTGGDVLAVFFSILMGSMALGQAMPPVMAFQTARLAIAKVLETINRKPLINSLSNEGLKPTASEVKGDITIKDLQFAYPSRPDHLVCRQYDLHIASGETVALVGASGCGKSTIINLLLRFYDPVGGSICLDGYNIRDLNIQWLRGQLGYVGQEPVLFAGSIAENILYGLSDSDHHELPSSMRESSSSRKEGDLECGNCLSRHMYKQVVLGEQQQTVSEEQMARIIEAAKMANAHDFISALPQGYNTDVGNNGTLLSGGQKQRIAIARALIKRPSVLLLDEATSALDAVSERVVQESIDRLAANKAQTIIIIAHRLSTIRRADKICVISEGKIVEVGRHEELVAKADGLYADLVRVQMNSPMDEGSETAVAADALSSVSDSVVAAKVEISQATTDTAKKVSVVDASKQVESSPNAADFTGELPKERSKYISKRVWGLVWQYPSWFILGFLGAFVFGAVFPSWGYMLSVTQKNFYLADARDIRGEARRFGLYYILFAVVSFTSSILQYAGLLGMGEKMAMQMRSDLFEALWRRDMGFFDDSNNRVGTLTTALADDCRLVHRAFSETFARQMQALCSLALSLGFSFAASWKITLIILATFPLIVGSSAVQMQAVTASQYEDVSEDKQDAKAQTAQTAASSTGNATDPSSAPINSSPGAILSTAFGHMRTVTAFSLHGHVSQQYAHLTRQRTQGRVDRSIWAGIGFGSSNGVQFGIYALLFWYGAILMRKDNLSFENLLIAIFALMLGALGLGQALSDMGDQKAAYLAADRIFRCLDDAAASPIDGLSTKGVIPLLEHRDNKKTNTPGEQRNGGVRIEFRDVSFHYPSRPGVSVCQHYNLTIEPGETVALVGPSGSGKSTIVQLLLRFYDANEGSILFDGADVRDINIRWLRDQMGYVGQEPVLFPGSVAENIARGRRRLDIVEGGLSEQEKIEDEERKQAARHALWHALVPTTSKTKGTIASPSSVPMEEKDDLGDVELGKLSCGEGVDDDVLAASRAAHAHEFVASSFPQGYATNVGEGSIFISGGQKQRIAIARALIKQPRLLLLDEATSALDAHSERLVQQSIDELQQPPVEGHNGPMGKPTMIIVAHRLATIRNADKICVVDKGVIVQIGSHDDLVQQQGGLYKQLWDKQHNSDPVKNVPKM